MAKQGCSSEAIIGVVFLIGIAMIYKFLGNVGTAILAITGIAIWIWYSSKSKQKRQAAFDELVLLTISEKTPPQDARKVNAELAKIDFRKADLVRKLQIIKDSLDIALASKKPDTANSRMQLAEANFNQIQGYLGSIISPETSNQIKRIFREALSEFSTVRYLNLATAHITKAEKLKTEKSKQKYYEMAMQTLEEGMKDSDSDKDRLSAVKQEVSMKLEEEALSRTH